MAIEPKEAGDGGFTAPRVFDTIEEAIAAGTAEDAYLDSHPELMVKLSDGTFVLKSVFGAPPADLPIGQLEEWYADRDEELVSANLGDQE